ncbi:MAG: VIT1/CCC1 transporter family protein [Candidatus Micrarchaeia archaeon]
MILFSLTRSLFGAKKAYETKDGSASKKAHDGLSAPEKHKFGGEYLKSAVYGGLDGTITTFAVVAGVTGAALSPGIVLIMGFANLIGDGISMAVGDYLSTKAENDYYDSERAREKWEADNYPDGEKREMVEIYEQKGIPKKDASSIMQILSRHKEAWVDVMMAEELELIKNNGSPAKNAAVTFISFSIFGFIPLATYVLAIFFPQIHSNSFAIACTLTACTLFLLGALKSRLTEQNWLISGSQMLAVGSLAAGAAYIVGVFLSGLA